MTSDRDWVALIESVCAVDSRTIAGAAGTTRVAELLGERLSAMGFALSWHDVLPEESPRGRHLMAVRNAGAPKKMLFVGHTDTVLSPADVPFQRDEKAGRIVGSGVCDMKGGDVLMLAAIEQALASSEAARAASLVVLLNCTEEIAGPSFRLLAREAASDATACLSFEPAHPGPGNTQQIIDSRKGVVRCTLTCIGRAAHSGIEHAFGVNAIREIARKVEALELLTQHDQGVTINCGQIHGGRAVNQVADEARLVFDVRATNPERLDAVLVEVQRICSEPTVRSITDGRPTTLKLDMYRSYPAWPANQSTCALRDQYIQIARKHGLTVTSKLSGGGADASHVADLTPTIDGLGILGGGLHQRDEWADLNSLSLRSRITAELITQLSTQGRDIAV